MTSDTVTAIRINPYATTRDTQIVSVSRKSWGNTAIYAELTEPGVHEVTLFDAPSLHPISRYHHPAKMFLDSVVFVDDEGLLRPPTALTKLFTFAGYTQALAGRGLVCGIDNSTGEIESVHPHLLEWMQRYTMFL